MTVSGEMRRTRSTKSVTVLMPCTVAVGLFGLLKKIRPAPRAAVIIVSGSTRNCESTFASTTGNFQRRAMLVQFSNVGAAVTKWRYGDVKARIALFRISCEPPPSVTFSALVLYSAAIVSTSLVSLGVLLNG